MAVGVGLAVWSLLRQALRWLPGWALRHFLARGCLLLGLSLAIGVAPFWYPP